MSTFEKRDANQRVFLVLEAERETLKALPGDDTFTKLQGLKKAVESLTPDDLPETEVRRPWKIRVPTDVYELSKSKAQEMGISILSVLVLAAKITRKPAPRKNRS